MISELIKTINIFFGGLEMQTQGQVQKQSRSREATYLG
jgi:hypothetical protein